MSAVRRNWRVCSSRKVLGRSPICSLRSESGASRSRVSGKSPVRCSVTCSAPPLQRDAVGRDDQRPEGGFGGVGGHEVPGEERVGEHHPGGHRAPQRPHLMLAGRGEDDQPVLGVRQIDLFERTVQLPDDVGPPLPGHGRVRREPLLGLGEQIPQTDGVLCVVRFAAVGRQHDGDRRVRTRFAQPGEDGRTENGVHGGPFRRRRRCSSLGRWTAWVARTVWMAGMAWAAWSTAVSWCVRWRSPAEGNGPGVVRAVRSNQTLYPILFCYGSYARSVGDGRRPGAGAQKSTGSRMRGQVMQCPPPRPRPSSAPTMVMTSTPALRSRVLVWVLRS